MAVLGEQRKHIDNAKKRDRARKEGANARALRGSIDRAAEEAAIEAAVNAGKVTRLQSANVEDDDQRVHGHSHIAVTDPTLGVSFGNQSRRVVR